MKVETQPVPEQLRKEYDNATRERQTQQYTHPLSPPGHDAAANLVASGNNLVASGNPKQFDPVDYVAKAGTMLAAARAIVVKAQAEFHSRREHEVIKMQERLHQMDKEHDRQMTELSTIVAKLEALRS